MLKGMCWIGSLLLTVLCLTQAALAQELTTAKQTITRPISLTYDFSVQPAKGAGTRGTITFGLRPPKTVGVQGQISYTDQDGRIKSEDFQGDYVSKAASSTFLELLDGLSFGSSSDPHRTEGTLRTRLTVFSVFSSEVLQASTALMMKSNLKPGTYQYPLSSEPSEKIIVTEGVILSTPVWTFRILLGRATYNISLRKDDGLPYAYEMKTQGSAGTSKVFVKVRSVQV